MSNLSNIMGEFNPDQAIEEAESLKFTKPKDGKYYVKITEAKVKSPTDENMGWIAPFDILLDLRFEIEADINGQECAAKLTDDSILLSSDVSNMPTDQKRKQYHINAGRYAKYCKILGAPPQGSDELIGLECVIELKTSKVKDKEYQNVENVWPSHEGKALAEAPKAAPTPQAATAASVKKNPWD